MRASRTICKRNGAIVSEPGLTAAGLPAGGRLFIPQGYEPGYDYPLVVWLADRGAPFDFDRAMARVSLRNFVAVQPGGSGEAAVWRAIDAVRGRLSIHAGRIFLVGRGAAGSEAFRIGCRDPRRFAGVVSLAGRFPLDESLFSRLDAVRRLPMLLCCRASAAPADACQIDRTLRLFHAAGGALAVRIYPQGRGLSRAMLGDVNRWIMGEVCGPPERVRSPLAT
jgi:phospholipase/carboxylesterase